MLNVSSARGTQLRMYKPCRYSYVIFTPLQGRPLERVANNVYPIWAHIQTVLGMSEDVAESYAECYGYFKQDGKYAQDTVIHTNEKFTKETNQMAGRCLSSSLRGEKIEGSRIAEVYGRIYADIFSTDKLILPSTKINIRLWPSTDEFRLMGIHPEQGGGYELKILDASLQVVCYKLTSALHLAQEKSLGDSAIARYFFYKTVSRQFTLSKNDLSFTASDIWSGIIPSKMYFVMISSDAFSGRLNKNPFFFHHYNCSSFGCIKSGYPLPGGSFLQMDYNNDLVLEAYMNTFRTLGYEGTSKSCCLSYPDFKFANNIYCFTSDYVDCATANYLPAIQNGQIDLNISFSKPLIHSVTLLAIGRHPAALSLDGVRNAIV